MNHNIHVLIRFRPLLSFENQPAWMIQNNKTIQCLQTKSVKQQLNKFINYTYHLDQQIEKYHYQFEKVFQNNISTKSIYIDSIKKSIQKTLFEKINLCIMAYGQTGTGKTYTISGQKQQKGINYFVMKQLFNLIGNNLNFSFSASYFEVYNEQIYDLLGGRKSQQTSLKIIGYDQECIIQNCVRVSINNITDYQQMLSTGERNRCYEVKQHHQRSSRSHTIIKIYINTLQSQSIINIVDLAGSEGIYSTQNIHQTTAINKSLFQLSNVIAKLSSNDKKQFISYRNSKITRLLQSSLNGNSITIAIFCLSPALINFKQSLTTLRLAEKTKSIKLIFENKFQQLEQKIIKNKLQQKLQQKQQECKKLQKQINQLKQNNSFYRLNFLVLLDHENFKIYKKQNNNNNNNKIIQININQKKEKKIKQNFTNKMQKIYQQYTNQIIQQYCQEHQLQNYKIQIDQICFMNMIYGHQQLKQYKLKFLAQFLKQYTNQKQSQFFTAIKKYYEELLHSIPEKINPTNSQNHSSDKLESFYNKNQIFYNKIYSWGSKKDYRVLNNYQQICNSNKFKSVHCGYHHTFVINQKDQVYGWGFNNQYQIFPDDINSVSIPTQIRSLHSIHQIAAGWAHSLALTRLGEVYSWGYGEDGQLGLGNNNNQKHPMKIYHNEFIVKISAGHSHSAFINEHGTVYTFGFNKDYRLMFKGHEQFVSYPHRINLKNVKDLSLGVSHSAIITTNGELYCGGVGTFGQLGVQLTKQIPQCEIYQTQERKFEIDKYEKVCPIIQMKQFHHNNQAVKVKCGENMTIVLNSVGDVYTFGKQFGGRLGHKCNQSKIILKDMTNIACGCRHAFSWNTKTKMVYGWGFNMYSQVQQNNQDIHTPVLLSSISQEQIAEIDAGFFHTVALSF